MSSSPDLAVVEPDLPALDELDDDGLLAELADAERWIRAAQVHQLRIVHQWAVTHPGLGRPCARVSALPLVVDADEQPGGDGTPAVAAFTSEPLGVVLGVTPRAAEALLADTLDLVHRLPLHWSEVQTGRLSVSTARRLARHTRHLSVESAAWVDRQLVGRTSQLGTAALDRVIEEAAARCEPETLAERERRAREDWDVLLDRGPDVAGTSRLTATGDTADLTAFHDRVSAEAEILAALGDGDGLGQRKAKALGVLARGGDTLPLEVDQKDEESAAVRQRVIDRHRDKVRLYLHASVTDLMALSGEPEVAAVESLGPITTTLLKEWLEHSRVSVVPVLRVAGDDQRAVDQHDPPPRMAEQVRLRDPHCVFPWCSRPARQCDLDHEVPYVPPDEGGPPGQTRADSLAPLCRRHHRAKTSGAWIYQPTGEPGSYLWTGPRGLMCMVTPTGSVTVEPRPPD